MKYKLQFFNYFLKGEHRTNDLKSRYVAGAEHLYGKKM